MKLHTTPHFTTEKEKKTLKRMKTDSGLYAAADTDASIEERRKSAL